MTKRNIEAKISGDVLRFFCIENKESIVACAWYDTHSCLKTCDFYKKQEEEKRQAIKKAKYWTR